MPDFDRDHPAAVGAEARLGARRQPSTAQPYPLNTRVALKNVLAEAAELGFGFNLGIECEIFLLQAGGGRVAAHADPDDELHQALLRRARFMDSFTWLDKVATTINDLGWDLYSFDHEDANGQFEFDFNYADALTMCDRLTSSSG